jgi:sulfate transport system permease protein
VIDKFPWYGQQQSNRYNGRPAKRETNTMPLHVEILYNEYNFTAAFAVASLLAFLALGTLLIKTLVDLKAKILHKSNAEAAQ